MGLSLPWYKSLRDICWFGESLLCTLRCVLLFLFATSWNSNIFLTSLLCDLNLAYRPKQHPSMPPWFSPGRSQKLFGTLTSLSPSSVTNHTSFYTSDTPPSISYTLPAPPLKHSACLLPFLQLVRVGDY